MGFIHASGQVRRVTRLSTELPYLITCKGDNIQATYTFHDERDAQIKYEDLLLHMPTGTVVSWAKVQESFELH